jgi:pimeloyl-ACP methyl ester carboxylesterase
MAAHDLLCRDFAVTVVEAPEPGGSRGAVLQAVGNLGLETFNLMGTSAGATAALELALEAPARVLALVLEAPLAIDGHLEGRLADLAVPTLVVLGTRDDIVPPAAGRVYKDRMPNAHLVFVYDAGHAVSADRPEAFAEVVADFLERHEAFVISRARTVIHP